MVNARIATGGLAIALLIAGTVSPLARGAGQQYRNDVRPDQYGGSLDARQHGYEHAYRVGADRGRQDRDSRAGYNFKANDYQIGARDYETAFGNRNQYMTGYRDGYRAGYDDGYNDRGGQYGQIYGRPADGNRTPTGTDVYTARPWGASHMAFDVGYRDGVTAGGQDHARNERSNFRASDIYLNADLGFRVSYGDRDAYRLQFRDGFERGYQDGYGRSQYSSDGGGYFPQSGRTSAVDTRDGQGAPNRTIIVPGNQQWTPTSIRVNQGDTFGFQATGEIRFSTNANDRAGVAGAFVRRFAPASPLPQSLLGALIGRIDNGRPFGIGNQTSLRMPASGILYLGINDDYLADNTGQFEVVISW